jgi:hypothetical protein
VADANDACFSGTILHYANSSSCFRIWKLRHPLEGVNGEVTPDYMHPKLHWHFSPRSCIPSFCQEGVWARTALSSLLISAN